MPRAFIIFVRYGGLGDHLFYSHLPRIAKTAAGYDRVLVSNASAYRHPDTRRLVWESNPYVDGFTDDVADYPVIASVSPDENLLDRIMLARGLDDGLRGHEPETYYAPGLLPEFESKRVYDPNYISGVRAVSRRKLARHFRDHPPDAQFAPMNMSVPLMSVAETVSTESLFRYADIIKSSRHFSCLTSGGATLAAALGKPATVFFGNGTNPMFLHSHLHTYVDVARSRSGLFASRIASALARVFRSS